MTTSVLVVLSLAARMALASPAVAPPEAQGEYFPPVDLEAMQAMHSVAKAFCAEIRCPVLYIVGAESGGKRNLQDVAAYFADGEALLVDGAGHWVHHDRPELVVEATRKHFARLA